MAEQPVAQRGQAAAGTTERLKRRGILAAAGAVVAGLVAKQVSEPVAATSGSGDQGFLALGSNPWYLAGNPEPPGPYTAAISSAPTVIQASPNFALTSGKNGADRVVLEADARLIPPGGGGNIHVDGIKGFASGQGSGVYGESPVGYGIQGYTSSPYYAGVLGFSNTNNGVEGSGGAGGGSGIIGNGGFNGGVGVFGYGRATTSAGVVGIAGTGAIGTPSLPVANVGVYGSGGTGVIGASSTGPGVYGNSSGPFGVAGGTSAPNGYGGYFATAGNSSYGLGAQVQGTPTGSVALYASAPANNTAGYFTGDVYITGSLTVANMANKHGLLHAPDGTAHLLYTMEAPESWAEDFGTGTLSNGKASVALEPLYASLVRTDDYHVFLTPHADTNGLHVTQRGATGFMVQEHKGGTASLTFSWRVVAKPKGGTVERLGKYTVPAEPREPPPLPKITAPPTPPSAPPPQPPPVPPKKP